MTDNPTNTDKTDGASWTPSVALDSRDGQADIEEDFTEIDDIQKDLTDTDNDNSGLDRVPGTGAVSGGFGLAGLALAVVSLTTNWTSSIVVSHSQISEEAKAPSSGLTAQQQLNMYANGWHTQGWWALAFAAAAVLCGAGTLLWPRVMPGGRTPGWAKAASTSAIIVGLVGALLAVLTIVGVLGGHLTAG